ncbi:hypothetical protein DL768_010225 [Monosporascus sp. mg162]|nr:hypothetical protein DL768_010225 [Monosporascus sp. mg162]
MAIDGKPLHSNNPLGDLPPAPPIAPTARQDDPRAPEKPCSTCDAGTLIPADTEAGLMRWLGSIIERAPRDAPPGVATVMAVRSDPFEAYFFPGPSPRVMRQRHRRLLLLGGRPGSGRGRGFRAGCEYTLDDDASAERCERFQFNSEELN